MIARLKLMKDMTKVDTKTNDLSRYCVWRDVFRSGILAINFIIESPINLKYRFNECTCGLF
jgi:hypothetical protein